MPVSYTHLDVYKRQGLHGVDVLEAVAGDSVAQFSVEHGVGPQAAILWQEAQAVDVDPLLSLIHI